ncbi:putative G-protein coupled receptor C06G4.5 [Toxocara canis]|uniref:Putative G-protein coupled receptor C06G4.5 n=1 Tax=Toxocara canis TaxID=6265 RepID=A0A0B2VBG5_TOXCA|nr:putative G-protein coupled receptor C06G4.5 [Toxocara canis]
MAIVDQLLGFWMFGTVCCKIYRTLEHVGRALSTFVLAAMAFDRFQRVWYPHHKTSRSSVFICLATLTLTTFLLLSPIIVNTFAEEIVLKEFERLENCPNSLDSVFSTLRVGTNLELANMYCLHV